MENLLFEIKYYANIKNSTSLRINSLVESSLLDVFSEDKIKSVLRLVQDLIEVSKKVENKKNRLFELQLTKNGEKLGLSFRTIIQSTETESITSQLEIINKTIPDSEAFKAMYKTKLRTGIIAGNNSAQFPDLNLIDLGRELKEKIEYSFAEIDILSSFLCMKIQH
jgi:inactivated superfamily I helicase